MGTGIWNMNGWELIVASGPIIIPIILCSLVALAIIIEKAIYFNKNTVNVSTFKEKIFDLIKNNQIKEAIRYCDQSNSPVAQILRSGVIKFNASKEEMKENMEDTSQFVIPKLESRLNVLSTIAHIAPLLGLLGTVIGMTNCFYTIQAQTAALNPITPGDLAGGIAEALFTTIAGLIVAILSYVAYNYFINRINYLVNEMERAATELIHLSSGLSHTV